MTDPKIAERALRIVETALEAGDAERQSIIERACDGDAALRREVESILEHEVGLEIAAAPAVESAPDVPVRYAADDRYELHDEIARGAMGQIIRATDRDLKRHVALKVVLERHDDDRDIARRFLHEATITAALQHPGVPPVYEVGRFADGRRFFAMRIVDGQALSTLLASRADPGDDRWHCLDIFASICRTLSFAHYRGVIHRDLKPDNIIVGDLGEVHVIDWGLATAVGDQTGAPSFPTRVGMAMGTPPYMPPEQFEGRYDTRTDVFALGAMLCAILTGAPPYVGETPADVLAKSARADLEEATARLDACGADEPLVDLARRCLEVDPERRPTDAGEVLEAIQSYRRSVESRAHAAGLEAARAHEAVRHERRRRRLTLALAGTIVASLTIALILVGRHDHRMRSVAQSARRTNQAGRMLSVADGQHAAAAIPLLEEAIRLDPRNEIAHADLSWAYLQANRPDAALAQAEQALERDASQHQPYYIISNILRGRGQLLRAAEMADTGVAHDPDPDKTAAILFRHRSAFCRVGAAFGDDTTVGVLGGEEADELLRQALVSLRTNLEYLSSSEVDWLAGHEEASLESYRVDPRFARVRDPEALRRLSPELREGWQQFWNDLDAALADQ